MQFNDEVLIAGQSGRKVAYFTLSGRIIGGEEITLLHAKIREHLDTKIRCFVIDMKETTWVNAVGLGMLINARNTIMHEDGRMVLAHIGPIKSTLAITQLITVFEHCAGKKEALASFS